MSRRSHVSFDENERRVRNDYGGRRPSGTGEAFVNVSSSPFRPRPRPRHSAPEVYYIARGQKPKAPASSQKEGSEEPPKE